MKVPGSLEWRDNIISTLNNSTGDVSNELHIVQQLRVMSEPSTMYKVVTAGESVQGIKFENYSQALSLNGLLHHEIL